MQYGVVILSTVYFLLFKYTQNNMHANTRYYIQFYMTSMHVKPYPPSYSIGVLLLQREGFRFKYVDIINSSNNIALTYFIRITFIQFQKITKVIYNSVSAIMCLNN